ncbi:hypothetical protein F5144DRAFT_546750 [Chaetomium tenue]|uniref:Uncharacterized protein n=1 Tax=Chaetomium tenue TaxID=1854479 RepID=A0ACB7PEC7_9PEZI|nr:hypothetical protein F5144DRAFT_546750 [Chaetomium globosum]
MPHTSIPTHGGVPVLRPEIGRLGRKHATVGPPEMYAKRKRLRWRQKGTTGFSWSRRQKTSHPSSFVCGKDPIFKSVTLAPPAAPSGLGRLKLREMREIRDKDRS